MKYRKPILVCAALILLVSLVPCWRVQMRFGANLRFRPIWHDFNEGLQNPIAKAVIAWDVMNLIYLCIAVGGVIWAMRPRKQSSIAKTERAPGSSAVSERLWTCVGIAGVLFGAAYVKNRNVPISKAPPPAPYVEPAIYPVYSPEKRAGTLTQEDLDAMLRTLREDSQKKNQVR